MGEFIGVADFRFSHTVLLEKYNVLKREALLFQRIAVPALCKFIEEGRLKNEETIEALKPIEWLLDNNIVFAPEKLLSKKHIDQALSQQLTNNEEYTRYLNKFTDFNKQVNNAYEEMSKFRQPMGDFPDPFKKEREKAQQEFDIAFTKLDDVSTRMTALGLQIAADMDAVPILLKSIPSTTPQQRNESNVVNIVINKLPIPDDLTTWEQILEYRQDPDSYGRFLDLRNWMSEVARGQLTPVEIEQKLEYLISKYQRHTQLHKMKTNSGTLETIVVTGAEMLGNIVSFKWGKAAQALFSLRKRHIDLLEGELTAPGNEIAYIVKANETFS